MRLYCSRTSWNLLIRLSHYSTKGSTDAAAARLDLPTHLETHLVSHPIDSDTPTGGLVMSVRPKISYAAAV